MIYENLTHLTTQFGIKRQKLLFSRPKNKPGKANIFQISEMAQGSNTLTLSLQKLQYFLFGSRGLSGLIYPRCLGVKPN